MLSNCGLFICRQIHKYEGNGTISFSECVILEGFVLI